MPFGFLGQLASGIGKGAKFLGGGIKSGIGKLGEMGEQMSGGGDGAASGGIFPQLKRPMPMTPGFNPDAPMPDMKSGGIIGKARDLINRQQPQPNAMPELRRPETPPMEPLKESVDVEGILPANRLSVTPQQTQMIPERQVKPVRPPDFLGTPGSTLDDTPTNHARFRYQTQYMQDGKIPRRWQDIAMNALSGAAQGMQQTGDLGGALGGAIAGGAGTAISPLHGRDYRFRNEQMPRLMEQQKEGERLEDRGFEQQRRRADMEGVQARTQATIAGTKDAELERRYRQSQIAKTDAQAEAARIGKPVVKMIADENTGEIYEAQIYPDGRIERRGLSGTATLRREGFDIREGIADKQIKSREGIADKQIGSRERIVNVQQRGATGRTGMTQAGQDRRQKERLASEGVIPPVGSVPVKRATAADVGEYARQRGISPEEARRKFEAKGYRVE